VGLEEASLDCFGVWYMSWNPKDDRGRSAGGVHIEASFDLQNRLDLNGFPQVTLIIL